MSNPAHKGQVYIGLIIAMGIMAILSQAIITLVFTSYDILNYTSTRTVARHIANEQIELIRNLSYDDIGTQGGIPPGILLQSQTVQRNGLNYIVSTSVQYIDDPFDSSAPSDIVPADYKRVRVAISWEGLAKSGINPVVMFTDVAPRGVETIVGGGTLSILVFDSNGLPVPQASVHIVANVNPAIDVTQQTSSDGRLILPGAPMCTNGCYQITVSKEGYSTDRTYGTSEVANPAKPHVSVIENGLSEISFAVDLVSNLTISSRSDRASGFATLPNQSFRLRGDKIIGTTNQDLPVYKYDETLSTDADGTLELADMEWDNYHLTNLNSSFDIAGTNPLRPIPLYPNLDLNFSYSLVPNSTQSLLAIFVDPAASPLASVSAILKGPSGFEATQSSGLSSDPDFGQAFFSGLTNAAYTLEATISGFLNFSGNVNVTTDNIETVTLTPQ